MTITSLNCHLRVNIINSVHILIITQEIFKLYATNEGYLFTFRHLTIVLLLSTFWSVTITIVKRKLSISDYGHTSEMGGTFCG